MNDHQLLTEAAASFLDKADGKTINEDEDDDKTIPSKEEIQKLIDNYGPLEKIDPEFEHFRDKESLDATYKMSAQQAYDYLMNHTEAPEWVIVKALKQKEKWLGLTYLVSKYKSADTLYRK